MTNELVESVGRDRFCSELWKRGYRLEGTDVYDTELGGYLCVDEVSELVESLLLLLV
jgi:hypothetical protein